jgi:hypothetical protein
VTKQELTQEDLDYSKVWWQQYPVKDALRMIRANVRPCTDEDAEAIRQICCKEGTGVWHSSHLLRLQRGEPSVCHCVPCETRRAKGLNQ